MVALFRNRRALPILAAIISILFTFVGINLYKALPSFTILPIKIDTSGLPCIDVHIEDKTYPILIDSGSFIEFELHSNLLNSIRKIPFGSEQWINFQGINFDCPRYILPTIKIGSSVFKNIKVTALPQEQKDHSLIWKNHNHSNDTFTFVGSLGRSFFNKKCMLLDVAQSKLILSNHPKHFEQQGYNLKKFINVSTIQSSFGFLLKIDTDIGIKKFLLDTGCTYTILNESYYPQSITKEITRHGMKTYTTRLFALEGIDFGHQELHFQNISEKFNDLDGALGMDFIKKHVIYIDFIHNQLYIKLP